MDDLLPLKVFLGFASLASAAGIAAASLPKGETPHRLAGRVALVLGSASILACLFWALPRGVEYPALCAVAAFYFAAAGRVWLRPGGPNRLERAISGMALIGSLAMVATAISTLMGFRAETMTADGAPMAILFGAMAALVARRNVLDFERDLSQVARQRRHGAHMIGAVIMIASALGFQSADRLSVEAWIAAIVPILFLAPLFILVQRRQG